MILEYCSSVIKNGSQCVFPKCRFGKGLSIEEKNSIFYGKSLFAICIAKKSWDNNDMSDEQRDALCICCDLPIGFIESKWNNMNPDQRDYCCLYQNLTIDFMNTHWWEMSCFQRKACIEHQEYIEQLNLEGLTIFLVNNNEYIRARALKRFDQLINSNKDY
jgi:hypothetical protein